MGMGRALTKVAALGATIAGVVFFWRKRRGTTEPEGPATAADR
jgi:hypothetical protein